MTTIGMQSVTRRLFSVRLGPSIFLLLTSYLCLQAGYTNTVVGRMVDDFPQVAVVMFFGLSWFLPLLAIAFSVYQLVRHRSLQHLIEIVAAVWLIIEAVHQSFKFTG